jgi:enoyl-CoA hydratase
MTSNAVQYSLEGNLATIRIDDGKRNALAPGVLQGIYEALDRAQSDRATVILTGREAVFSAGFDLNVMKRGGTTAIRMLRSGYALMLSADYVIGSRGDFRISANEVAIGLTMPRVAAAVLQHRLDPAAYQRAVTLSEEFGPESALDAGFFDELVEPGDLVARAAALADKFGTLDARAHAASKRRIRASLIRRIRFSLPLDLLDAVLLGLRGGRPH